MNDPESKPPVQASDSQPESAPERTPYTGDPDDLHDLIGSLHGASGDEEDPLAQLRDDPNYAALIRDLEYIATQARMLFEPAQDTPSDQVWTNIVNKLGDKLPDA